MASFEADQFYKGKLFQFHYLKADKAKLAGEE